MQPCIINVRIFVLHFLGARLKFALVKSPVWTGGYALYTFGELKEYTTGLKGFRMTIIALLSRFPDPAREDHNARRLEPSRFVLPKCGVSDLEKVSPVT